MPESNDPPNNEAVVRRMVEEVINGRNLDLADELIAPEYQYHGDVVGVNGPEGFKGLWQMFIRTFPDVILTIEDIFSEGDLVAARLTFKGTHEGEFMGVQATGRTVIITGINMVLVEDGRCVEEWDRLDFMGLMRQLGEIPDS